MRINHNIAALNTYNKLAANQSSTNKSLEKLSSGLAINKAGDNAAGLAISEKMRGQINGLDTASNNASDGISLINTAEGALNETHSILQRMRELSVQSSNDTNTTNDRAEIQKEVDQLAKEVTRIGDQTEFNTKKLLNGGAGMTTTTNSETVAGVSGDWISVVGGSTETQASGTIAITAAAEAAGAKTSATVTTASGGARSMSVNGTTINYNSTATASGTAAAAMAAINAANADTGVTASLSGTTGLVLTTDDVGGSAKIDFNLGSGLTSGAAIAADSGLGTNASLTAAGITGYTATGNSITVTDGVYKGLEFKINSSVASSTSGDNAANITINGNGALTLHIGANEGQTMGVSIGDMRAEALGISALDVTTHAGAESAITTVDNAVITVSSERAKLGAYTNRLEHTINNLSTSSENTASAESRIRDVDMAKEMTEFTKNNILSQAAQSMLAQANQQPQKVLSLLQ